MKTICLILIFFTLYDANAQIKVIAETELYEKVEAINEEFQEKRFTADSTRIQRNAYEGYSNLVKNFPNSEYYSYYLFSKGCFASTDKESKECFKEVIQANCREYYVRQSNLKLSFIAVREKEYDTALQYLDCIEKMKKPNYWCGNEKDVFDIQIKNIRKYCKKGLNPKK